MVSPRDAIRRSSSEARRIEDQRRANENYHPSEAAHHPPTLPAINMQHQQHQLPPMNEAPKEEHPRDTEVPARKLDIDEDYDDGPSQEEKKADAMDVDHVEREKRSPPGAPNGTQSNGIVNGPPKVEPVS
jgi:glucose repression mediator protein